MSFVVIVNCILCTCSVGDQAVLEKIPGCRSMAGALIPVVRSNVIEFIDVSFLSSRVESFPVFFLPEN